ncbi:NapC/NirT family cytochrome c [Candidatus Magnetaquicoccus inordinatus]|uniref:NapC/NirT family cytochrome c n=1 Tax=Candidatus Magnetaquicoccus inordinatus TaxID=2496818 RepID=UPI00187D1633|nr:NapC/NirT family cytochrome c [Candidatus Magnetaquicoccus inordinatus]
MATQSQEQKVHSGSRWRLWGIFAGGLAAGVFGFALFHFLIMDGFTNSLEMCISCHEMDGVYKEYQQSTHYKNPSGVRVVCASCHIPHGKGVMDYVDKLLDKVIVGGRHLYHHVIGTYPDAEAFEKARYRLAQQVLENMRQRDSKECRQCHSYESMLFARQDRSAASKHERMMKEGNKTCVDCHSGIVHEEPKEPVAENN